MTYHVNFSSTSFIAMARSKTRLTVLLDPTMRMFFKFKSAYRFSWKITSIFTLLHVCSYLRLLCLILVLGFAIKQTCTTYRPQNTNLCLNVLFFWWTLRPCERRLYYKNLHGYNDVMVIVNKHWWSPRVRFNRVWLYLLGLSSQFRLCPFCEALARSLICCCIDSR